MFSIIIGILAILLGLKGFTPTGLPFTKGKNLTGSTAAIVGVICIVIGAVFILDGVYGTMNILAMLSGSRR